MLSAKPAKPEWEDCPRCQGHALVKKNCIECERVGKVPVRTMKFVVEVGAVKNNGVETDTKLVRKAIADAIEDHVLDTNYLVATVQVTAM